MHATDNLSTVNAPRVLAAFRSRTASHPHAVHRYVRSNNSRDALTISQTLPVWEDGDHRSTFSNLVPCHRHLYSGMHTKSIRPASDMACVNRQLHRLPSTFSTSTLSVPPRVVSAVVALWWSRRKHWVWAYRCLCLRYSLSL